MFFAKFQLRCLLSNQFNRFSRLRFERRDALVVFVSYSSYQIELDEERSDPK